MNARPRLVAWAVGFGPAGLAQQATRFFGTKKVDSNPRRARPAPTRSFQLRGWGTRLLQGAALPAALMLSAGLTAAASAWPQASGLLWVSLVPLFLVIRRLRPVAAACAGAAWGSYLYFFFIVGRAPAIPPTPASLALLVAVPGLYAGLGALLTRALGFHPFLLGFGWVLVEVALQPLGLRYGLLAGTLSQGTHLHGMAHLLGYVFVAFLVASLNGLLVGLMVAVGWGQRLEESVPACGPRMERWAPGDGVCCVTLVPHALRPRAPPGTTVGRYQDGLQSPVSRLTGMAVVGRMITYKN